MVKKITTLNLDSKLVKTAKSKGINISKLTTHALEQRIALEKRDDNSRLEEATMLIVYRQRRGQEVNWTHWEDYTGSSKDQLEEYAEKWRGWDIEAVHDGGYRATREDEGVQIMPKQRSVKFRVGNIPPTKMKGRGQFRAAKELSPLQINYFNDIKGIKKLLGVSVDEERGVMVAHYVNTKREVRDCLGTWRPSLFPLVGEE